MLQIIERRSPGLFTARQREVTSVFTLETEILPKECVEAVAWVIHADTKEEAKVINNQLLLTMQNVNN
ncbi:hypothetical protein KEH51_18030 [[Brevibacterium] frigoritolerans]|uniref:Uncharacterized protein n=1 Tax=Peribacillus frigoritolerans TaxID=450367 RepID=A0A941FJJ9_9BACI|nr:hypothetical protein [Peribacillus frigoritolerans]